MKQEEKDGCWIIFIYCVLTYVINYVVLRSFISNEVIDHRAKLVLWLLSPITLIIEIFIYVTTTGLEFLSNMFR